MGNGRAPITHKGQTGKCGKVDGFNRWECAYGLCCYKYGYFGISSEYCGDGCQEEIMHDSTSCKSKNLPLSSEKYSKKDV